MPPPRCLSLVPPTASLSGSLTLPPPASVARVLVGGADPPPVPPQSGASARSSVPLPPAVAQTPGCKPRPLLVAVGSSVCGAVMLPASATPRRSFPRLPDTRCSIPSVATASHPPPDRAHFPTLPRSARLAHPLPPALCTYGPFSCRCSTDPLPLVSSGVAPVAQRCPPEPRPGIGRVWEGLASSSVHTATPSASPSRYAASLKGLCCCV